ncbi:MAG: hypothetical protein AAF721_19050 [Myxococcota bacterium]
MPSTPRTLTSLLSFALATSMAATLPATAMAGNRSVTAGGYAGTAALLTTRQMAPASVLGLDGEDTKASTDLTLALRSAFKTRGLSGGEEISLVEMRLTMGCENLDPKCLAEGGEALSVDKLVYGELHSQGKGSYQLEIQILDVATGEVVNQASEPVSADDLSASNIDAKAMAIVNTLLGSEEDPEVVPSAGTTLPDDPVTEDDEVIKDEPRESKYWFGRDPNGPKWKKAGLIASAVLAGLGVGTIFVFAIPSERSKNNRGWMANRLFRIAESEATNEDAPIPMSVIDAENVTLTCNVAENGPNGEHPSEDINYNATVATACRDARNWSGLGTAGVVVGTVGLASTIVFGTLLLVHKKKPGMEAFRRHQLRLGVSPTRGGASVASTFRF